ncbi:MAG: cytochrome c, partial [Acidobacteriaceae bacterium]
MVMHPSNSILRWTLGSAALAFLMLATGCRQDMQDQPKMIPQRESTFFANGRSVRPQVEGTVARGQQDTNDYFHTGISNQQAQDLMPFPVTMPVLERGQ